MSGGQHNPNGRQAQLGSAWNHLQLQVPYLGRVPQAAHMSSERAGVTWHTPTPPLHPYHAPSPASPDPMQALKVGSASGNSVFRHTPTPPDRDAILYRHTPTPPDKLYRHTPSPGDSKAGAALPPAEIYPIPLQPREKMRAEELLAYARGGVDLTLGRPPANGAPLSLSVRDAPTINSLITAATARVPHPPRPAHARVDALLERLAPAPHSPHSVIVHPRAAPSPSPPDSNEDSTDSCGAVPGSKRKRKPDRTVKVAASHVQPLPHTPTPPPRTHTPPQINPSPPPPPRDVMSRVAPQLELETVEKPLENGDGPYEPTDKPPTPGLPHARRKTKSGSAETIDDIAAMIASTDRANVTTEDPIPEPKPPEEGSATIEVLKSVLGSPDPVNDLKEPNPPASQQNSVITTTSNPVTSQVSNPTPFDGDKAEKPASEAPEAPKRRSTRSSRSDTSTVPENPPSEIKPAETTSETKSKPKKEEAEPIFVEVENQLEKMFAGIEEKVPAPKEGENEEGDTETKKRRRSRVGRKPVRGKASRRSSGAVSTDDGGAPKKITRKKSTASRGRKREGPTKEIPHRDAYDSGSNASSGRSRGPYVQIRGPRDSPLSVNIVNATTGEDDCDGAALRARPKRRKGSADGEFRNGLKSRGLHCSTLSMRYDATTPDSSWVCVFCELGPHAGVKERLEGPVRPLGDLFGPYTVSTACEEYRALDESRQRWHSATISEEKETREVWFHEDCGLWAPGLVAAGARLSGLQEAVWGARSARCGRCGRPGAGVACAARACPARAHVNCARATLWKLEEDDFRALCPRHSHA